MVKDLQDMKCVYPPFYSRSHQAGRIESSVDNESLWKDKWKRVSNQQLLSSSLLHQLASSRISLIL